MADISLTTDWIAPQRPRVTGQGFARRLRVFQRRARRDLYLANFAETIGADRAADLGIDIRRRGYPWIETLFGAMHGR